MTTKRPKNLVPIRLYSMTYSGHGHRVQLLLSLLGLPILVYLAKKYGGPSWLPEDPEGNALVQQWFSLAAGQIAFGPCAACRLIVYDEELVPMRRMAL